MASGWAYFRKHWIKPEVYPLIGAMSAALGICGYAMFNKARDPTLGWNKSKRKHDLYEDVEEVVPIWSSAKKNSTSIFSSSREILESKKINVTPTDPITIKIGDAEEEEDEAPVDEQPAPAEEEAPASEVQSAEPAVADAVSAAVDVIDETAETINAAIDAAIESSAASLKPDASEQTASSIAENPPPAQSVQPTAAQS